MAAKWSVGRCMVLVGCLMLICAMAMGARLAAAQTQLGETTLAATEEELGQRNESTRVFLRHYEQPILDEEGKPTGEVHEFTRKVVEKADCLNYDAQDYTLHPDGPPIWEPTVCDFQASTAADVAYEVKTGKAKVYIGNSLTGKWPITYRINERDTIYELGLGIHSLAYYDASTGEVRPIEAVKNVKPVANGNHLLYSGAFTIGDLEYIYDRSTFEQNLIIRNLGALVDPASLGMKPESTYVGIISTLDLPRLTLTPVVVDQNDAEQPLASGITGDRLAIAFKDATGTSFFSFDRSEAWDASAEPAKPEARKPIRKHIGLLDNGTGQLFEGIPYSWLTSSERQLPVTLDYQSRTGTANGNEAWQSGVTYFVSGNYTVPNGKTLVIEGGAIVKINESTRIYIDNGGKLLAEGSRFKYIFVTKATDSDVGESVGGSAGDGYGIQIQSTTSADTNNSIIRYCKFRYQNPAIKFLGDITLQLHNGYPAIAHNIFRSCPTSILFSGLGKTATAQILNCLFIGQSTYDGILANMSGILNFEMINCTFDQHDYGFRCQPTGTLSLTLSAYDNVFTDADYDMLAFGGSGATLNGGGIDYCAYYRADPISELYGPIFGTHQVDVHVYPYKTSPNGSFYTGEYKDNLSVDSELKDAGEGWGSYDYDAQMQSRTIIRPHRLDCDNINTTESGERHRFDNTGPGTEYPFEDTGSKVDIGYHYDIVNAVIDGNAGLTTGADQPFVIQPGSTISYKQNAQLIVTGTDTSKGYLKAEGQPNSPILFTSTLMTGDAFLMPAGYHYVRAIDLYNSPSPDILIKYCVFSRAQRAIFYRSTIAKPYELNTPIGNCVFRENYDGIYIYNTWNRVDVWNSLFVANENAGIYDIYWTEGNNRKSYLNLQGNTFSENNKAVLLENPYYLPTAELRAVVEDNIFSSNNVAIATSASAFNGLVYDVTRNNMFWNNGTDIQNSALDISDSTNKTNTNPLFCDRSLWFSQPQYPLSSFWNDGYFLAQRSTEDNADASRRAYRLGTLTNIASQDVIDIDGLYYIFIGVSEGVPSDIYPWSPSNTYKGRYSGWPGGGSFTPGTQSESGPTWVLVWSEEFAEFGSNPRFKMTTSRGTMWVYLPPYINMGSGEGCAFFLAEDGSTYWGNTSKGSEFSHYFNQDAYYAERWASQNVARSAFTASGQSPAIDAGSRDLLSDGYTNTSLSSPDNPGIDSRIDIGYHYFGSLRHPLENVETISAGGFSAYPKIEYAHHLAIASGNFDDNQNDTTIVTYRFGNEIYYDPPDPTQRTEIWLYKIFRDSSVGSQGVLEQFIRQFLGGPIDPRITATAMTSVPKGSSSEGTIYAACTVNWWKYFYVPSPGSSYYLPWRQELDVWRYKEASGWKKICSIHQQNDQLYGDYGASANDLALVARNNDLWVFYTKNTYPFTEPVGTGIAAVYLKDAATWNEEYLMSPYFIGIIRNLNTVKEHALWEPWQESEDPAQIDASWDDKEQGGYPGATGSPHIIWCDLEADGNEYIWSAWVPLDSEGKPLYITERQKVIMSSTEQFWFPAIEVNDYDDQKFSISDAKRAFASSRRPDQQPKIQGYQLPWPPPDPINPWEQIAITDRNNSLSPDTTFRTFATPRFSYLNGGEIFTNTERVYGTIDNPGGKKIFTRITTNTSNLTDVFLIYSFGPVTGEAYTLHIMEVDP